MPGLIIPSNRFQAKYTYADIQESILQADIYRAYREHVDSRDVPSIESSRLFDLIKEWLPFSRRGKADDKTYRVFGIRTRVREQAPLQPIVPRAGAAGPLAGGQAQAASQRDPAAAQTQSQASRPAQPPAPRPVSASARPVSVPCLPGAAVSARPAPTDTVQAGFPGPAPQPVVAPIRQKTAEERIRSRLLKQWGFIDGKRKLPPAGPWVRALSSGLWSEGADGPGCYSLVRLITLIGRSRASVSRLERARCAY